MTVTQMRFNLNITELKTMVSEGGASGSYNYYGG